MPHHSLTHTEDAIETAPTLIGIGGRAWLLDNAALLARAGIAPANDATLAAWLIEAPLAHPLWHSYWLCLVHLRPMPDGPPLHLYREGATHEFWLYALDPDQPRQPQLDSGTMRKLLPMNFAAQLVEPSDDAARQAVRQAVAWICDGRLSPDTDFIAQWVGLFGDSMLKR